MSNAEIPLALPVLRDEPPVPRPFRRNRAIALHVLRLAIVLAILGLIRDQTQRIARREAVGNSPQVSLEAVAGFFPTAMQSSGFDPERGTQQFADAADNPVGFVVQTAPKSDAIIGFSGPTNLLLAFDANDRVVGAAILNSRDTREHVELIRRDPRFLSQWDRMLWEEVVASLSGSQNATGDRNERVDAVSGATLTSLAMIESLTLRFSGSRPSLKFPQPVQLDELRALFPDAATLSESNWNAAVLSVRDASGREIGFVVRTSPAADSVIGYQGPTETLIGLDIGRRVIGIRLRASFDNDPYVRYVREEDYFLKLFNGRTLPELAALDLFEARVEGVSGATMTSMAVAQALIDAAKATPVADPSADQSARSSNANTSGIAALPGISARNAGTLAITALGLLIGFGPARLRRRLPRRFFQLVVIGGLGLLNGDLISMAILVGWPARGIPWRFASGLVALTALALLVPLLSREQLYCNHLCPHGAVQQLVKRRVRWQLRLPRRVTRLLSLLPLVLLAAIAVITMRGLPISLVDLEPFDAWIFRAAGPATISIAIVGLIASLFVPMAYCRFGCPTGALLGFIRFNGRSDQWHRRDTAAVTLLLLTALLR